MKIKRILILLACFLVFTSTVYAANLVVTNQNNYYASAMEKTKTLKYNYGTLNITSGPVRMVDAIYAYFCCIADSNYKSQTATFEYPASKQLFYNPFDYNTFCNKKYTVYAKVRPYSYSSTILVQGDFTP